MNRKWKSYDEMKSSQERTRKRPKHIESGIQIECIKLFRLYYPKYLIFSVPNGGARNAREAAILSAEGVVPGVSDLIAVADGKILFIEMKAPKGRQSGYQKAFQAAIERLGFQYRICHSVTEFDAIVRRWLKGESNEKK